MALVARLVLLATFYPKIIHNALVSAQQVNTLMYNLELVKTVFLIALPVLVEQLVSVAKLVTN